MKDIPIIFSKGPMVRALLDGRKTMTRRLAWGKQFAASDDAVPLDRAWKYAGDGFYRRPSPWQKVKPGDRLWARESICKLDRDHRFDTPYAYKADTVAGSEGDEIRKQYGYRWTPSIHCPRAASRLTLIVTATKIERLQDISENDARAEGVTPIIDHGVGNQHLHRIAFEQLWCALHGDGAWVQNPEIVALTFTVHQTNIDAMAEAA